MGNKEQSNTVLWLILASLFAAFFLCYLDRCFFRLALASCSHLRLSFFYIFGYGMELWRRILRLVYALIAGFLIFPILNRNKLFFGLTWILWFTCIQICYLTWFENPFWFKQDPFNFFWRIVTILPFLLGARLSHYFPAIRKLFTLRLAKLIIIGLGIITIVLDIFFFVKIVTHPGYHATREYAMEILPEAEINSIRSNPFFGRKTVEFTITISNPDSIILWFERQHGWQIAPKIWREEGKNWQIEPGWEWKWQDFSSEPESERNLRGYGSIEWIDLVSDVACYITVVSRREDPENLYRVTLIYGPAYYEERMEQFGYDY